MEGGLRRCTSGSKFLTYYSMRDVLPGIRPAVRAGYGVMRGEARISEATSSKDLPSMSMTMVAVSS